MYKTTQRVAAKNSRSKTAYTKTAYLKPPIKNSQSKTADLAQLVDCSSIVPVLLEFSPNVALSMSSFLIQHVHLCYDLSEPTTGNIIHSMYLCDDSTYMFKRENKFLAFVTFILLNE